MDAHALPRAVLEEVAASKAKPHVWSDEYVKTVTDWARHHGIRGAIDRHAKGEQKDVKLPWSTVDRVSSAMGASLTIVRQCARNKHAQQPHPV